MTGRVALPDDTDDVSALPSYFAEPPAVEATTASVTELWHRLSRLVEGLIDPSGASRATQTRSYPADPWLDRPLGQHDGTGTFLRMIDVPGAVLQEVLESWWRETSARGVIDVGGRLRLLEPQFSPDCCGGWCLPGHLRRGPAWAWLPLPVALELFPRLTHWSLLHLRPERGIHPTKRYFTNGHALLDTITEALVSRAPGVRRRLVLRR